MASRLDGVWSWAPMGRAVEPVRAAALWGWAKKVDHEPAMADVLLDLPTCLERPDTGLPVSWRPILRRMQGPELDRMKRDILARLDKRRSRLLALQAELNVLTGCCAQGELFPSVWEGLDGFQLEGARGDGRSAAVADRLAAVYVALRGLLLECLPGPGAGGSAALWRVKDRWSVCIGGLRVIRNKITHAAVSGAGTVEGLGIGLADVREVWTEAQATLAAAVQRRRRGAGVAGVDTDWDGFYASRADWARRCGMQGPVAIVVAAGPPGGIGAEHEQNEGALLTLNWPPEGITRENLPQCLQLVEGWLQVASQARQQAQRMMARDGQTERSELLRAGDFRAWAQRMKPARPPEQGYCPEVVALADGTSRRPRSGAEVRQGAAQEWAKLVQKPATPWASESVAAWVDGMGHCRGRPAYERFAGRAVSEDLARIGRTYCSKFFHVEEAEAGSTFLMGGGRVRVGHSVLWHEEGLWWAELPWPVPGCRWIVVRVNGGPPDVWCMDR